MENQKLSKNEMKKVLGGASGGPVGAACSTTCKNGSPISITDCLGTCIAIDQQSVHCSDPNKDKYCLGFGPDGPK
jgi:hypothetical protein